MRTSSRTKKILLASLASLAVVLFFMNSRNQSPSPVTNLEEYSGKISDRAILTTDGVKHIIPTEEIIGGGPEKDDIPSIDNPEFISAEQASEFLTDASYGVGLEKDGVIRFYPFQILARHEVVNDTIHGQRILISYSPLCRSAIVFDPLVDGERVEFGTSGKIWNSGGILYDRKTNSLWSHLLGQAIQGAASGTSLASIPSVVTTFASWKQVHPDTQVFSTNTGSSFSYEQDPYLDYYASDTIYFPIPSKDNRKTPKTNIVGLVVNSYAKAYDLNTIKQNGTLKDTIGGEKIQIEYNAALQAVTASKALSGGTGEQLALYNGFWFCWSSAYPQTQLSQ